MSDEDTPTGPPTDSRRDAGDGARETDDAVDDPDDDTDTDVDRDGTDERSDERGDRTSSTNERPQDADAVRRDGRVERFPTEGSPNSLRYWTDAKSPLRVALNYVVVWLVRISPSLRLKNWLLARIGVTVGDGVSWGLEATPDVFWPEHITLRDHAIVGYDATLLCHEFLQEEYRVGDVVVGERAMIGAGAIVLPGVEIGDGAQVAANSLVTRDVPPNETVAGVPARPMSTDDDDEIR